MVYEPGGGVFHRFVLDAVERDAIRVVQSEPVRWPLVHSEDLANLYALAAARPPRSSYIGAAPKGLPSAASHALLPTRRMGEGLCPRPAAEWREGAARSRLEAERLDPEREIPLLPETWAPTAGAAFGSPASCTMISVTSTWSRRPCNPSTTRSARGCHPCLRYDLLPMSPGRTKINLERAKGFEPSTPTLARSYSTTELHPHPRDWRRSLAGNGQSYAKCGPRMQQPMRALQIGPITSHRPAIPGTNHR